MMQFVHEDLLEIGSCMLDWLYLPTSGDKEISEQNTSVRLKSRAFHKILYARLLADEW